MAGETGGKEPSIEALLAQASDDGWGFFEHAADPRKDEAQRRAETSRGARAAALAAALATVPEFNELIEFLLDGTLRRVTFTSSLNLEPMAAYAFGQFREGQNALMYSILKLIAEGRKQAAPPPREP